jgi:hypothetical protein
MASPVCDQDQPAQVQASCSTLYLLNTTCPRPSSRRGVFLYHMHPLPFPDPCCLLHLAPLSHTQDTSHVTFFSSKFVKHHWPSRICLLAVLAFQVKCDMRGWHGTQSPNNMFAGSGRSMPHSLSKSRTRKLTGGGPKTGH